MSNVYSKSIKGTAPKFLSTKIPPKAPNAKKTASTAYKWKKLHNILKLIV